MKKNISDKRLAVVVSHPIQYYSPLYRELSKEINLKVFYCFNPSSEQQGKDGFGIAFKWDIDLFDGYDYEFLNNISNSPSSSYRSGCDTPEIAEALNNYGTTHVVTFGWHLKSYQQALKYCKRKCIPIAVRGDSKSDKNESYLKKIIKWIYYPIFLRKYDAFLSVGKENKKYLKKYKVPESKIIFSPHAVDQTFWSGEKKPQKNYTFIWVAKFIPLKRPFDVIDAFLRLYEINPDIKLKMVGSGPLLKEAMKRASNCNGIHFLGFKNQLELREEYLSSHVLILSSDSETWGLVVNEALSTGLRVIMSSEVGCFPDLIRDGVGYVYSVGNKYQLSEFMKRCYNTKNSNSYKKDLEQINTLYSFKRNLTSFKDFLKLD